mmetsp:Transcript_2108/g.3726  ORF Transcript_2108/g.3726 Transcript_2108/m.3726 type:complete len:99 (-) Transcript_2108:745-1041(-)|eukprot:CAMPEP_0182445778 /NCGR_PEP_ID=MMETSP1172-20130603/3785_1 /TAXON_ID=708627 /ORGANISM="Timspurckia oligopyrenoides, Strain CCMP3278" /LENGTH=98 /DNA_ID=CAMNT_0024641603 /DNA_START=129 /DNA_END=425 /DNA_ORIENTATION=+
MFGGFGRGVFGGSRILFDGRLFYDRMKKGMIEDTKASRRNRRKRQALMIWNAEVLKEGERMLAIQLMADKKAADLAAAAANTQGSDSNQTIESTVEQK